MGQSSRSGRNALEGMGAGILLIGLGVLFWTDNFWPWILVVAGLAGLPSSIVRKGLWVGLQGVVWMVGLAIIFALDVLWPGILILVGLSTIAGALVRPPGFEKSKRKPKRGLPNELDDAEPY